MITITANNNIAAYSYAKIARMLSLGANWNTIADSLTIDAERALPERAARIFANVAIRNYRNEAGV